MATSFPASLDELINPQASDSVQLPSHSEQHADANDAIEALQEKVGADNSTVTTSLDYRVNALENASLDEEGIQQIAADLLTNGTHTNIVVTYDDANDKINLEATYGNEEAISAIATALTTGTGITKTYNQNPPNYLGDYNNGAYYAINDVVSIPVGSPYGIVGSYFIRSGNAGNPGYPPEPGGATNGSWTIYVFSPTITIAVDTNAIATQSYVNTAVSNLIDSAPGLLDTLNEIAAAIGDDANFATTITNALALKAPLASPALTGTPTAPTATTGTNTTQIATTEFVKTAADGAVTAANEYTDEAVASLGNTLPTTYVSISDVGNPEGVASLDINGKVPLTELDIDLTIQNVASSMITGGAHTNISTSFNNVTKKLSFSTTPLTQDQIQDFVAPLFTHSQHTNITATYDDDNNRIVLSASGGGGGGASVTISSTAPTSPALGNIWLDSDNGSTFIWDGVYWVEIGGASAAEAIAAVASSAPANPILGRIWLNSSTAKTYIYDGSYWVEI